MHFRIHNSRSRLVPVAKNQVQIGPSGKKPGPDWSQLQKTWSRLVPVAKNQVQIGPGCKKPGPDWSQWQKTRSRLVPVAKNQVQIGPSCKKPGPDWPQLQKTYYALYSLFICTLVCAGELLKLLHNFVCKFPTINWSLYTTVDHAKTLFFCIKLSNFL